ncbi:MAG: hypothetical protein H0V80_02565 [Acidobacteria bacterium]|nr:hypothetical protein [Acidobacteriota bacterium]
MEDLRLPHPDAQLLAAFRRAASDLPWYRTLLSEQGVHPGDVSDTATFSARCPALTKHNTFDRFPIAQLCATTPLTDLGTVLTSSGHGGRFSFGLSTRAQDRAGADAIDEALDATCGVRSIPTLAINCLPMGVGFSSQCMTMATTSVREDMAVALIDAFGSGYEQIVLVADPLFVKRLTDHARERGLDWGRHRLHVVIGEEVFGEHFRGYLAAAFGFDLGQPAHGYLMSSFGVGELGLHLCYETPATIALRRASCADAAVAADLLGPGRATSGMPMLFAFNPLRTFVEVDQPDADGYGRLTISMLDPTLPIPLLRYQTGDVVRLLDRDRVSELLARHRVELPGELPEHLLALVGREREALPNGSHVSVYKDALYANHAVAQTLTGAVRIEAAGTACTLHVQLGRGHEAGAGFEAAIRGAIPADAQPAGVVFWPYHTFPYGMTLDYERKFTYYVAP